MNRIFMAIGLISIILFVLASAFITPATVEATAPASVKITYNKDNQFLTITILHDTRGRSSHYIKIIEIKKNGAVASIKTYNAQDAPLMITYQYRLTAIEEDTLQAFVTCSEGQTGISPVLTVP